MALFEPRSGIVLDELEDELARAFDAVRSAVGNDDGVVLSVDDEHLGGAGGNVAEAALAHGLLGLARAAAFEGRKDGWKISVMASSATVGQSDRDDWAERLSADGSSANGALLRLGGGHLGRLPT